jgi:hypothetical protein
MLHKEIIAVYFVNDNKWKIKRPDLQAEGNNVSTAVYKENFI